MSIICSSQLTADPGSTPIPGDVDLIFDVQVNGDDEEFLVRYTILTNAHLVRFASGRPEETVRFTVDTAQMRIRHPARFVCADPGQNTPAFASFTVGAEVLLDGHLECTPNSHPAIIVSRWECHAPDGAGAFEILEGRTEVLP